MEGEPAEVVEVHEAHMAEARARKVAAAEKAGRGPEDRPRPLGRAAAGPAAGPRRRRRRSAAAERSRSASRPPPRRRARPASRAAADVAVDLPGQDDADRAAATEVHATRRHRPDRRLLDSTSRAKTVRTNPCVTRASCAIRHGRSRPSRPTPDRPGRSRCRLWLTAMSVACARPMPPCWMSMWVAVAWLMPPWTIDTEPVVTWSRPVWVR